MPTNYPTSIDTPTDPTSSEPMTTPSHSGLHTNSNDAVVAIETFVGTTAAPNFAKLGSPHFTGVPTAPTNATATDATTQLATDAFVQNAVSAYAAPGLRLIYADELGADPTGVNDSSAVIRAKQTALGTASYLLVFGAGSYLMNSAFVNFGPQQGAMGQGDTLTALNWGGPGPLIIATDAVFSNSARAGKFTGFEINGPYGSGTASGIQYSNLQSIVIGGDGGDVVGLYGLPGGAILGANPGGGYAEEGLINVNVSECGAGLGAVFQFVGTSFDYTKIDAVVVVEANIDILSITGGAQMRGLNMSLRGNCHGGVTTNTGAIIAIERGNAGAGYADNVTLAVAMEANNYPGPSNTVGHWLIWMGSTNGSSQFIGQGSFLLLAAGATCQGGVGFGRANNANYVTCTFSGMTNDLTGGSPTNGSALEIMGGTDYTTGNIPTLNPVSSAGTAQNVNWAGGDVSSFSLGTGANTSSFAGNAGFVQRVELFVLQPSSGAPGTLTWPSSVKWVNGVVPTLSKINGAVDLFRFTYVPATGFYYGEQVMSAPVFSVSTLTVTAGAVTVPVGYPTYNFTVVASTTITLTTTGAYDGQHVLLRILDGGSAETLTFANTENSSISVPTVSAGSSTIPRTVDLIFNSATTKWTCVHYA